MTRYGPSATTQRNTFLIMLALQLKNFSCSGDEDDDSDETEEEDDSDETEEEDDSSLDDLEADFDDLLDDDEEEG